MYILVFGQVRRILLVRWYPPRNHFIKYILCLVATSIILNVSVSGSVIGSHECGIGDRIDPKSRSSYSSIYICLPGETHHLRLMSIWLDYSS
jgi:hypothetical protein